MRIMLFYFQIYAYAPCKQYILSNIFSSVFFLTTNQYTNLATSVKSAWSE